MMAITTRSSMSVKATPLRRAIREPEILLAMQTFIIFTLLPICRGNHHPGRLI